MKHQIKILLLEDTPLDAELIKRELIKGDIDHELLVVHTKAKFQHALENYAPDIILSDHSMPNFTSHDALSMLKAACIEIPFILITSTMTDEFAVKIMKEGASDYIIKDRLARLPDAVKNAIEKFRLVCEQTTERIKANEQLKHLNYRLQLATQSARLGIWDWDIVNNKLNWDDRMHQIYHLGDAKFESIYEAWLSKLHPGDKDDIDKEMKLALSGGKKYDTEFRIIGQYGRVYTLRATGIVEWDETGTPLRMIGVNWDISDRRAAAKEREKIIGELSRRNAELEQFGYIVSHNLRAPLVDIIGLSNTINDLELSPEERNFCINGIYESSIRVDTIIKDINNILEIKADNYVEEA